MSNRIDLTQFEGITKGEWVYHEGEDRFLGKTVELHIPHPDIDGGADRWQIVRKKISRLCP